MFEKYDAYKDSGVDWIGSIPSHWYIKKAKFLFVESDERSNTGSEELLSVSHMTGVTPRAEKNVSMFMAEDYSGSKLCKRDDLVMNIMWAWMGALGVSAYEGIVSPSYGVYRQKNPKSFNSKYLEYLLKSTKYIEYYNQVSTGLHSSRLRFYGHMFLNMKLGFPDLNEQDNIIGFLNKKTTEIDQAISIKEQQIALLNERKQIVIQQAVTQGLDPNVPMKDSDVEWIGLIPEHWNTITKLKHIASLKGRQGWQGLKADEYIDEGPYVVSSAHFEGLDINWDKCPHVSRERYEMDSHIQLNIADILLMKDGAKMGKMAYISNLPDLACLNSHLLLIRSLKTQDEFFFDSKYMLYFMLSEKFQDYVQVKGTGTTFMGISQESIGNFPIALPSLYEQIQIASFLDQKMLELEKGKDLLLTQIAKLKEYKTTLINDAVTGKIKVA